MSWDWSSPSAGKRHILSESESETCSPTDRCFPIPGNRMLADDRCGIEFAATLYSATTGIADVSCLLFKNEFFPTTHDPRD
ncbi:MAG: hypothetical protein CMJ46_08585 [Planctomyces sp.]|nr:hypothetical protein [Planctomyces sp.]